MTTKKAILVVEDDHLVRQMLHEALENDYEVFLAADGFDGMQCYERHGARIAVVVTDVTMPRLNGVELMEWLRRQTQWLPVVFMTAYGGDSDLDRWLQEPAVELLLKPFEMRELLTTLNRLTAAH